MSDNSAPPSQISLQSLLEIPWGGLRPDLVIYPGPMDFDGHRSWILEDPVRGNNYRLGHAEGELVYRLTIEPDLDAAIRHLYRTTPLRPSIQEIVGFVSMLQKESLAVLPSETVVKRDSAGNIPINPGFWHQIMRGNIFFKISLLRPDAFLTRTISLISLLWSPLLQWTYLITGIMGITLVFQEIDLYINNINYLFTPQGWLSFMACLILLKIGHEFSHAYTAKAQGLHIRSMGLLIIIIWPLLYTDTTDAWKLPDRKRRMWISAAGVYFELVVAGIALFFWAILPDGIPRSLMFFLSGTSLASSLLININPFMRYDGYYMLMEMWGIDNLRPRAFAMLRHLIRRLLLDWKGPAPEIHPLQKRLILYGFLALLYRIFICVTIAVAVYIAFFPALGILLFVLEILLFLLFPLWIEIKAVFLTRRFIGSKIRVALSAGIFLLLIGWLALPLPHTEAVPALFLYKDSTPVKSPVPGQLSTEPPKEGKAVEQGELLGRISSDSLDHEKDQVRFDLERVRATLQSLGSGGEQGAHRKWLFAEEDRLKTSLDKYTQAVAQLEIRSPVNGMITDVNPDIYKGAFVGKDAYLFTVAVQNTFEVKAFVHEQRIEYLSMSDNLQGRLRFAGFEFPDMKADFVSKSLFPVQHMPNISLYDVSGGPITSIRDNYGIRPRDAYFVFTFEPHPIPSSIFHGMPAWVDIKTYGSSILGRGIKHVWSKVSERGFY